MFDSFNFMDIQVHGGGNNGLAGALLVFFDFIDELLSKKPPEMFGFLFPGVAGLDNIHPLVVHYPIAFMTVFIVVEMAGLTLKKPQWRYVAGWLLYLGTVFSAFAVVAGMFAAESVDHNDAVHAIMEKHERFGISVLSIGLFLSAWRMLGWGLHGVLGNGVFLVTSAILALVLSFGADLGGMMVYNYGVAVQPVADALVIIKPEPQTEVPSGFAPSPTAAESGQNGQGHQEANNPTSHDHSGHDHHHGHNHKHSHH